MNFEDLNKTVKLNITKIDGNAFALMGAFRKQAKKENWSEEEISCVIDKMMSGDYNNLVVTLMLVTRQ
jgi:formylmethanofuran dehydrogenase subunit C